MNLKIYKCSVMHIGHNNLQSNYNMSKQRDLGIITTKDLN